MDNGVSDTDPREDKEANEKAEQTPGQHIELPFDPGVVAKQLFDNVNFGGPSPGGELPPELVAVFFRAIQMYAGPVPPPEMMEAYKRVDPSFPERIFTMAEKQSEHRTTLESKRLSNDGVNERIGLFLGGFIVLGALTCGTIIILEGANWFGFGVILVAAAGLAAVFRADLKKVKVSLGKKAKVSVRASGTLDPTKELKPGSD